MGSPVCLLVVRDVSSALMGGVVGVRWVWEGAGREHEAGGSVLTVTISEAVMDTCSAGSSEYCHFAVYSKHTYHIHRNSITCTAIPHTMDNKICEHRHTM